MLLPLLCSLSASVRFITFGKRKEPRIIWSIASCSSCFFFIPESLCQLIIFSINNKLSLVHQGDCCFNCLIRPTCIYLFEPFCYYLSSNLCVLNTTNTD